MYIIYIYIYIRLYLWCIYIYINTYIYIYVDIYSLYGRMWMILNFQCHVMLKSQEIGRGQLVGRKYTMLYGVYTPSLSGWWFGTWLLFSHILGIIIPSDFHIFQRGWNHQPVIIFELGLIIFLSHGRKDYWTKIDPWEGLSTDGWVFLKLIHSFSSSSPSIEKTLISHN